MKALQWIKNIFCCSNSLVIIIIMCTNSLIMLIIKVFSFWRKKAKVLFTQFILSVNCKLHIGYNFPLKMYMIYL